MKTLTLAILAVLSVAAVSLAKDFNVDNAADIRAAMAAAQAGDTIAIKPGEYDMGKTLVTGNSGAADKPITMRTVGDKGYAKLRISTTRSDVGFRVNSKFWVLRGLHIEGNRAIKDLIMVSAPAGGSDFVMVDCKISNCGEFLIKASRSREQGPDNVILEHCEWFDSLEHAIDLVSGDNWVIRGNYVHDYGMNRTNPYGMYLKGGGKNGIIEGNLVDGNAGAGKGSIGISFGGGLTGPQWLPLVPGSKDKVAPEHTAGICRNNIVINTGDCAYHGNNASDCKFYNNLAYNCAAGFQMQGSYPPDSTLINNVLSGDIKKPGKAEDNLTKVESAWFVAPDQLDFRLTDAGKAALASKGQPLADNPTDFFGGLRKAGQPLDLGPVNADAKESTKWIDRRAGGAAPPTATTPTPAPK
jgi:hypothetical protein